MAATERMERAFGCKVFPHAAFYEFEHALRFDLAGEAAGRASRFLRAMDRARAVADVAFRGARVLSAVVLYADGEPRSRRRRAAREALRGLGFRAELGPIERLRDEGDRGGWDAGGDLHHYLHVADFEARASDIEALIWPGVAAEMGITPEVRWLGRVYLADFDRRLALHVYDDRGMDVFAMDREPLQPLYDTFGQWLLEHDRSLMDRRFGPAISA